MTHIQQRRDPSTTWASVNPVLYEGEAGHETDTGKWKLGDGATAWNDLPYKGLVDSVAGKTGAVTLEVADIGGAAPLASPVFTGNPTAPTPAPTDNDTSLATTEFVKDQGYATVESPAFTGNPTVPTPVDGDSDLSIANTEFVSLAVEAALTAKAEAEAWQDFTPVIAASFPGDVVVHYARLRIAGGMCRVQVSVGNVHSSTFFPALQAPVMPAAHYWTAPNAPGELGRIFPGVFRWGDTPGIGDSYDLRTRGCVLIDIDYEAGDPATETYIACSGAGGGNFIGGPVDVMFWDSEYEIDLGSS